MSVVETESLINERTSTYEIVLSMKATFHSARVDVKPEFIWVFTPEFIGAIKNLSTNPRALEKISNFQGFVDSFIKKV